MVSIIFYQIPYWFFEKLIHNTNVNWSYWQDFKNGSKNLKEIYEILKESEASKALRNTKRVILYGGLTSI